MNKLNSNLKSYADERNVKLWQVAEAYGVHESTFCKKLRRPFSEAERKKTIALIDAIAKEADENA